MFNRLPVRSAKQNAFEPAPIIDQLQKRKLNTGINQSYLRGGQFYQPPPGINAFQPLQSTGNYQQQTVRTQKTVQPPQSTVSYQKQALGGQKTVKPPPGFEHLQPLPGFKHLQPHPSFKQIGPAPGFSYNMNRLLSQSSITQPKTQ